MLQALLAAAAITGQIDSVCREYCQALAVQQGAVRYVDQTPPVPRNLLIGKYLRAAQRFVPATEAPVRDLRSLRGWRIVVSAFLRHDPENAGESGMRLHFFGPDGVERLTYDALAVLDGVEIGRLFGGNDEVLAVTSEEEHAYNVETVIWYLPERSKPQRLIWIRGTLGTFTNGKGGNPPGVTVARETYDGKHPETKGTVREFYIWDSRALTLAKKE